MFRGAAILQGVFKRAQLGNASDERAQLVGSMAATCAAIGLQIARGQGDAEGARAARASAASIFEPSARLLDYKFRLVAFMERFVCVACLIAPRAD